MKDKEEFDKEIGQLIEEIKKEAEILHGFEKQLYESEDEKEQAKLSSLMTRQMKKLTALDGRLEKIGIKQAKMLAKQNTAKTFKEHFAELNKKWSDRYFEAHGENPKAEKEWNKALEKLRHASLK